MAAEGTLKVGYAISLDKRRSLLTDSFLNYAKSRSIEFVEINLQRSIVQQGPFGCIIHKLFDQEWKTQLEEFQLHFPTVPVIDSVDAIEKLRDRVSMLESMSEVMKENPSDSSFGIPEQRVVYNEQSLHALKELQFPLVAKPVTSDGSPESHQMHIVFGYEAVTKLKPPVVLQKFVNHGGILFKVFVLGGFVECVKRKSLEDIRPDDPRFSGEHLSSFSKVSNVGSSESDWDEYSREMQLNETEKPPEALLRHIASGLRKSLKLHLFNFDVIRDAENGRYLIVDINYFPGFSKMPGYERVLTEFLLDVMRKKQHNGAVDEV